MERNGQRNFYAEYKQRGTEKRYAYEWFMRAQDYFYWQSTLHLVQSAKDKLRAEMERKYRYMTALAVTSTVIAIMALIISLLH